MNIKIQEILYKYTKSLIFYKNILKSVDKHDNVWYNKCNENNQTTTHGGNDYGKRKGRDAGTVLRYEMSG